MRSVLRQLAALLVLTLVACFATEQAVEVALWAAQRMPPWQVDKSGPALVAPPQAPPAGLTIPCKIRRVIDGDTVEVSVEFFTAVRLQNCWAPELSTPEGREAKAYVEQLLESKTDLVLYVPAPRGAGDLMGVLALDRVLGFVFIDNDRTLNQAVVEAGHATAAKGK